jgi:hypothetical protein
MNDLLKKLKNIKDDAYSLINEVDTKINKTSIEVELSVSEIKEIIRFMDDGFRANYRYDYYLREKCKVIKKLEDLIN